MRRATSEWSIRMLADFKNRINVEAEYQRGKVWTQPQQALLIDSIMRGFDIPKIFLRKLPDGSRFLFDVIDGKQRLTAIWRFVSDKFRLLRTTGPLPGLGDVGGKTWSGLSGQAKDKLQFSNITVSMIEDATDDEIRELFLRLQKGEPLRAAEKRNAIAGPVRDFVADRLANHSLWTKTRLRNSRFGWHEQAAIVLALVKEHGPTGLKGADLYQLYENNDFDPNGEIALHTIRLLDQLEKIADVDAGVIRTRWGIVDLAIVLLNLEDDDRSATSKQIMAFFKQFEDERRQVAQTISDIQTRLVQRSVDDEPLVDEVEPSQIPREMFSYHLAFAREGASKENVDARSTIMYKKLLKFLRDPQGGEPK